MSGAPGGLHGTAVVVGDRGVLILGPSGSGKTTLALALAAAARQRGQNGRIVADDRTILEPLHGRLVARAPDRIAGLAEFHGLGPRPVPFQERAVIDLAVRLEPAGIAPRLDEGGREEIASLPVPLLVLPRRAVAACVPAILTRLGGADGPADAGAGQAPPRAAADDLGLST